MNKIDAIANQSNLKQIHPRVKMIYTGITLIVCLWASDYVVSLLLLAGNTYLITKVSGTSMRDYVNMMKIPVVFLFFTAIGMMIHFPMTTAYLYEDSLRVGELVLRVWAGCSSMFFLSFTTPVFDMVSCLHQWKMPEFLTDLMLFMYRFIFLLLDVSQTMQTAQRARLGYDTKKGWMKSTANIAVSLFMIAYRRSEQLFTAMECRLYDGKTAYWKENREEKPLWYAAIGVWTLVLMTGRLRGWML